MPQPGLLAGQLVELEGQRRALPQHRQRGRVDLDFSGGDVGVDIALRANFDHPGNQDTKLRAQPVGAVEHVGIAKHDLGDARSISRVAALLPAG